MTNCLDNSIRLHVDKSVITIKGFPVLKVKEFWTVFDNIVEDLKVILGNVSQKDTTNPKYYESGRVLYRRMKMLDYGDGQVMLLYDRDFRRAGYLPNLCSLTMTWKNKADYRGYHERLLDIDGILDKHLVAWHVKEAELALDTQDPVLGKMLHRSAVLRGVKAQQVFHWDDDRREVVEGCSRNGNHTYQGTRHENRQLHGYVKDYDGMTIYRTELTLRRDYLWRKRINSHRDLIATGEQVFMENVLLKEPKLLKRSPQYQALITVNPDIAEYPTVELIRNLVGLGVHRDKILDKWCSNVEYPAIGLRLRGGIAGNSYKSRQGGISIGEMPKSSGPGCFPAQPT
jgi:hypothetical protein